MEKRFYFIKLLGFAMLCTFVLTGCFKKVDIEKERQIIKSETSEEPGIIKNQEIKKSKTDSGTFPGQTKQEPETTEADWSDYFDGFHGAAVVYDTTARQIIVHNSKLAETRRSPCSTFKIISSLIALENGIIEPDNSTRKWSGEVFWNEKWNHDIDFSGAFHESCVWYFRKVIDEIGKKRMQKELNRLAYGNCDISDWKGQLNTNNNNRALTGFWLESSLKISPREQTEVMERIFGENSVYSGKARDELKKVMRVEEQNDTDISFYGKTGMGKAAGIVVDAWFTGFEKSVEGTIYFCVYLGRTDDKNVSSAVAKEIAFRLVSDYYRGIYNKNIDKK